MEYKTVFKGVIGTPDDVANFNIEESNKYVETVDEFHISAIKSGYITGLNINSKGGIIIPRLFAVYQDAEPILERNWSFNYRDQIRKQIIDKIYNAGYSAKEHLFLKRGLIDNLHTHLICVAYDPAVWNKNLVADALKDKIGRVKIVQFSDLPEFHKKDTFILDRLDQVLEEFVKIRYDNRRNLAREAMLNHVKDTIKKLEEQLKDYGLTSEEYATIKPFKSNSINPPSELELAVLNTIDAIVREFKE